MTGKLLLTFRPEGREAILKFTQVTKLADDVDLNFARATAGFSGADFNNLNEGALIAARRRKMAERIDLDDAREKFRLY